MKIILPLILSTIAGLGTLIGALFIFIPYKNLKNFMTLVLAFSGSIMILISIFDLIPPSIYSIINKYSLTTSLIIIFIAFILGMLLITILDRKIENSQDNLYKIGVLSMIALMIHNFPEGIATFMTSYVNIRVGSKLSLAILLHNIPEGICIAVPIINATHSLKKALGMTLISSFAEPLGALCAYIFLKKYINSLTISIILIFVAGIMITLSINNICKESLSYHNKKYFVIGIFLSVIYIIFSMSI